MIRRFKYPFLFFTAKTRRRKTVSLVLFYFFLFNIVHAQNLEKIGEKDMFTMSGGLQYSSIFYHADGINSRRDPFNWFFNGNVTMNFLDVSLPFTYSYTNRKSSYTQPFNIQGVTPTYKWAKGYGGFTSMNFSPYTLSGHIFLGGGIELSPKHWKFSGMYGRLKKAVEYDALTSSDAGISYKRMGYGGKIGYEKNSQGLALTYFAAHDDATSLLFIPPGAQISPMENAVVSLAGKTLLWKKLRLEAEYALSGLTQNTNPSDSLGEAVKNKLPVIFCARPNSQFFDAVKSSAGWQGKDYGISLNYERIAPGYQTLGAYFFNNDLENITVAPNFFFWKGKLNLSANSGLQRNNLDGTKLNTTKRWVNSVNLSCQPSLKWNITASYSNFSSFTRQLPQTDPFYQVTLDTLNFYQLTQQANFSSGYRFGKKEIPQTLQFSGSYQVTGQFTGAVSDPGLFGSGINGIVPVSVINGNLSYSISFSKSKTNFAVTANANRSELPQGGNILYTGPGIHFSKSILKNTLRVTAGSTYNLVLQNGNGTSSVMSNRAGFGWNPKMKNEKTGKISLSLSAAYVQKFAASRSSSPFSEFTGNFGAGYSF
ncbi:MAG: hypothetical protein FD123_2888 [Bacteroidetes bacterium]|nr:MAG: hypothetical protein FD123_2888 [Bacteroidota bacterium]